MDLTYQVSPTKVKQELGSSTDFPVDLKLCLQDTTEAPVNGDQQLSKFGMMESMILPENLGAGGTIKLQLLACLATNPLTIRGNRNHVSAVGGTHKAPIAHDSSSVEKLEDYQLRF